MKVASMTVESLINKTLMNSRQTNTSNMTRDTFENLLQEVLLNNDLTGMNNSGTGSIADFFSSSNALSLSSLGLNLDVLGAESKNVSELLTTAMNSGTSTGASIEYKDIKSSDLDSLLNGALKGTGHLFVEAGEKYQINPALLASIAIHETGNGTSNAALYKHNVAGMMGKNGLRTYASVEESIFDMARNLRKNYLDEGKTTIAEIGAKYAPIGASNDPNQLNNHWVSGVQQFFDSITNKTDFA